MNFISDLLLKISDHYPVEVQLKARMHPDLEKSVRIFRNVILIEDDRMIPEKFSLSDPKKFSPFSLNLYYDESQHIAIAELKARFKNIESARSGLKQLRVHSSLPYSIFALVSNQIEQIKSKEIELSVTISHTFLEGRTTIIVCQI